MRGGWALGAAGFGVGTVLLIALVATLGALAIHFLARRRRGTGLVEIPAASAGTTAVRGSIDLPELAAAMRDAAARMDLPERLLPLLARPSEADGDFVYREGEEYVYCTVERGTCMAQHRAGNIDDLLYRVFRDRAWTRTYTSLIGQNLSPAEHETRLSQGQIALLARADARWAERLRAEQG